MTNHDQLELAVPVSCKYRCGQPVVGSSTTGEGHVCRSHNELEWGKALVKSKYWPEMGLRLIDDSEKGLARA